MIEEGEEEEESWRCRRHGSQPPYGVCPTCLRDRLSLLCTDCAKVRPCGSCRPSPPLSSSRSSSSSDPAAPGAVPSFGRSRSAAVPSAVPRPREATMGRWEAARVASTKEEAKVSRSRSVGAASFRDSGGDMRLKSYRRYIRILMKAFRLRVR